MTLVELMVAGAIGLFLIGGALYVYSQSKTSYRSSDSVARVQESARFALETLEPDVRLAGFWGRHSTAGLLTIPAGIAITCGGKNVTAWALKLEEPVAGTDDKYDLPCAAFTGGAQPGSDVLVVRHASGAAATAQAGQIQVRTHLGGGQLFADGNPPVDGGVAPETFDVIVDAYYVARRSSFEADQPSLRRLTLGKNGLLRDEEVIPGVENLQVQYGIDTDGDGAVERFVDADHPLMAAGGTIVAIRIWMLVGTPVEDAGFSDTRAWPTPDADLGDIVPGQPGHAPGSRRLAVSKTIFLRNQQG